MKNIPHQPIGIAACLVDLNGHAPSEIQLLPAGVFKAKDGRPANLPGWKVDARSAGQIIAAAGALKDQCVIDYEHQTLYSQANGQPAPAAGWFKTLAWREGVGVFATDVEWTDAARAAITAKEYRYISPVLRFDPRTGEVTAVLMAALVNYPAIDGMADLAAAAALIFLTPQDSPMDELLERLRYFLNMPTAATAEEMTSELDKIKAQLTAANATAAAAGLLSFLAAQDQQIAALSASANSGQAAQTIDPAKYMPVEAANQAIAALRSEVAELRAKGIEKEVDALVEAAIDEGKLEVALKAWAIELGNKDLAALKGFIGAATGLAALKGRQSDTRTLNEDGSVTLSADEVAACKALGLSEDDYKKSLGAKA